jgi:hypothetical protein
MRTPAAGASAKRSAGCALWLVKPSTTLRAALSEHTGHRIRAAIALLDTAVKVEIDDLAQRIEVLEALGTLLISANYFCRQEQSPLRPPAARTPGTRYAAVLRLRMLLADAPAA